MKSVGVVKNILHVSGSFWSSLKFFQTMIFIVWMESQEE